jgi:hypothetical protein
VSHAGGYHPCVSAPRHEQKSTLGALAVQLPGSPVLTRLRLLTHVCVPAALEFDTQVLASSRADVELL